MNNLEFRIRSELSLSDEQVTGDYVHVSRYEAAADAVRAVLDRCADGDVGLGGYVSTQAIRHSIARELGVSDE